MDIHIATAQCQIKNPTIEYQQKCELFVERTVTNALKGSFDWGADVLSSLIAQGKEKLIALLQHKGI